MLAGFVIFDVKVTLILLPAVTFCVMTVNVGKSVTGSWGLLDGHDVVLMNGLAREYAKEAESGVCELDMQ